MTAKDVLLEEGHPGAQPKANSILALGKECQTLTNFFFFFFCTFHLGELLIASYHVDESL